MGYAVFTARKIMLTSKINNLNFRLMALSQQKQNLSQMSGNIQQMFSNMSMAIGSGMGMGGFGGIFGNMLGGMGAGLMGSMYGMNMNPVTLWAQSAAQQQLSAMQQMNLKPVAMAENQIDLQMKTIETQLNAANKELEKVEQAEEKAVEKSAPKFA